MATWIIVVERDDQDPLVVGFETRIEANEWRNKVNDYAEKAWPNSYHNYARVPEKPHSPQPAWSRIKADERP